MTRRYLLLLAPAVLAAAPQGKREKGKAKRPPEVEVLELSVRRDTGVLQFDGRVRNCGDRPLEKLVLLFFVTSPDDKVVTTQRGQLDVDVLEPGEDRNFEWQARDHARAVTVTVGARIKGDEEITVLKPGPYPIE